MAVAALNTTNRIFEGVAEDAAQIKAHNVRINHCEFQHDDPEDTRKKVQAIALEALRKLNEAMNGTDEICLLDRDPARRLDPYAFHAPTLVEVMEEAIYEQLKAAHAERQFQ